MSLNHYVFASFCCVFGSQQGGMKRALSSSDEESAHSSASSVYEYEDLTPHQKKIRLAKEYVTELKNNHLDSKDIEATLHKEIEEVQYEQIADKLLVTEDACKFSRLSGTPISMACTIDLLFVGCDNGELWIYGPGFKSKFFFGLAISVSVSPNHKFLAVACDTTIHLFEIKSYKVDEIKPSRQFIQHDQLLRLLKKLNGHRKKVTHLLFDKDSSTMYSVSNDRSLKIWSIKYSNPQQTNDSGYIDTLFGHQDVISDLKLLSKDKPITIGNRDKSTRIFNIVNASQMVFRVPNESDACTSLAVVNINHFIVGTSQGHLLLYNTQKKRPIHTTYQAHSHVSVHSKISENTLVIPNPISHLQSIPNTDVVISSSCNQFILWKCDLNQSSFIKLSCHSLVFYMSHLV